MDGEAPTGERRKRLLAVGGMVGAVLASSCCVAPLVLLMLGVSGAWIGNLTALAPYQSYFIAATLLCLGGGFWFVYWKPRADCEEATYCANPAADRLLKTVLWVASGIIAIAITVDWWSPLLA